MQDMRGDCKRYKNVLTAAARWAAAAVFLLTALLKAAAADQFAQTIVAYGFPRFQFMAPVIIVAEVLLAMFLVFGIYEKWTGLAGTVMIAAFTLLYSYALVFKGITDCGCFGGWRALNNNTVLFYVKNALLLAALLWIFFAGGSEGVFAREGVCGRSVWKYAVILVVTAATAYCSGYTFNFTNYKKPFKPVAVKDSPLHNLLQTRPDSTYVVFAFSYTCPHCMNSVCNINEYEAFGVADRIVGLALGDSVSREFFMEAARPRFPVYTFGAELLKLTATFPRTYYISQDSIRYDLKGEAPAPYIFKRLAW